MTNSNRTLFRRSHDPWWDLEGLAVRRQRKLKTLFISRNWVVV